MTRAARPRAALETLAVFPARRPRTTLAVTLMLGALSVLSISRIRPDPSIESMFSRDDPAAAALMRVLNHFAAAEELLVLASVPEPPAGAASAPEDPAASAERLLAFARRFEQGLADSSDAAAMADGV